MAKGPSLEHQDDDRRAVHAPYIDLDRLKNSENLVAVISQRRSNGAITFAIFKEFERDGRLEKTTFIADSYRDEYLALVKLMFERIDAIKAEPALLAQLQQAAGYIPTPARRGR